MEDHKIENFREKLTTELYGVEDLPTLPDMVFMLESALLNPYADAREISQILGEDPSLTARVLKMANSVYYSSAGGSITSLQNAIARVGFNEVRNLVTTVALIETFGGVGPHLNHNLFWKHSITVGIAARSIKNLSESASAFDEHEAYVAGLLHDIGILLLDQFFPDVFRQVRAYADEQGVPYNQAERELLGMDHGEIGGVLLEEWSIPESVVAAVTWHHRPEDADPAYSQLAETVELADFVGINLGIGEGGELRPKPISDGVWDHLGLAVDAIPTIIDQVSRDAVISQTLLSLD